MSASVARLVFTVGIGLACSSTATAQGSISWANVGTDWATGTNWTGNVAPANDLTTNIASFAISTPTSQPQIASNLSVAGVIFASGAGAFTLSSSGASVLTLGASGIDNQDNSTQTVSSPLKLGMAASFTGSSTGALAVSGTVDNNGFGLTLAGSGTGGNVISGAVSGTGGLIKSGTSAWTLSGANNYTGNTTINGGTLYAGASNTLVSNGNVIVNGTTAGTTTQFTTSASVSQTIGSLTLGGSGGTSTSANNVSIGTGSTLTLGGTFTFDATNNPLRSRVVGGTLELGATRTFNIGDSTSDTTDVSISSIISGAGFGLVKTGAGNLYLSGANTYTGDTTINGGKLQVGASNGLVSTNNVILNGTTAGTTTSFALGTGVTLTIGSLTVGGPGATSTSENRIGLGTSGTLTLGGTFTYDATNNPLASFIQSGTLELGATRTFNIGDSTSTTSEVIISATISGAGFGLIKTGPGELHLYGPNTYTGDTTVNGGTLSAHASNVLVSTNNVIVNGSTAGTTTFTLVTDATQTIGTLTLGGPGATSTSTNRVYLASGSTLTLGGAVTYDATNNPLGAQISGSTLALGATRTFDVGNSANTTSELTVSSVVSGTGFGLIKTGAGTLALSGANTYSGGTTVSAGTLLVNNSTGSGVGTGALTVEGSAFLGGSGFIGAVATIQSGAHLAPGSSPGTLTFTSGLTLDSGAVLDFQLGSTSDLIRVSGGTLSGPSSGTITLNLSDAGGFASGTYPLFNFTSAATSSFDIADFTFGTLIGGTQLSEYSLGFSGSFLNLMYTPIPEPGACAAIFAMAALGVATCRHRRRRSGQR